MRGQVIIWISILGATAFFLFILILISFSSLEVDELGLDYSTISKTVDSRGYQPGIHFLGKIPN